jgi:hypothetical protein
MPRLLDSFKHACFHSPRCNVHQFPSLYRCTKGASHAALVAANKAPKGASENNCTASIHIDMATQAGLVDDKGNVSCPLCGGETTLVQGETKAEIHAKLCTDETIHYPEMRKTGEVTEEVYQAWRGTLTREESMGYYKRVPDVHIMAPFTHEETLLMTTDLPAFNALVQTRLAEKAENALLHQVPYKHQTTTPEFSLTSAVGNKV